MDKGCILLRYIDMALGLSLVVFSYLIHSFTVLSGLENSRGSAALNTLLKLAITSPSSRSRSVDIVLSRTQATELFFYCSLIEHTVGFRDLPRAPVQIGSKQKLKTTKR
jgi:hypothetical protein